MEKIKEKAVAKVISLSADSKGDKILKMLVYTLGKSNLNKVGIKREDNTDESILALDGQPVVAKVYNNQKTGKTLGGHEATKEYYYEDGIKKERYKFGTNAIGVWQNTQIEQMEIEGEDFDVVTSEARVWKRFPTVHEAIDNLIEKDSLCCSYEISGYGYKEDEITWKTDIEYLGVALLGVPPAYPEATLLQEIAEFKEEELTEEELALTVALSQDLSLEIEKQKGSVEDMEKKLENSSLTSNDIYSLVNAAVRAYEKDRWIWVCHIMPYEFEAYAKVEDGKTSEYVKYSYVVNSDETVSVTSKEDVEMIFVSKVETEETIAQKESEIAEKTSQILEINETITSLQSTIAEKEAIISQLEEEVKPLREQAEIAQKEKEAKELAEKQEAIKGLFLSSGLFEEADLEVEEIAEIISTFDEAKANKVICNKVVANAQAIKAEEAAKKKKCAEEEGTGEEAKEVEKAELDVVLDQETKIGDEPVLMTFKPKFRRR